MLLVEVVNVWSVAAAIIVVTVVVAVARSAVKVAVVDMSHTVNLRYMLCSVSWSLTEVQVKVTEVNDYNRRYFSH